MFSCSAPARAKVLFGWAAINMGTRYSELYFRSKYLNQADLTEILFGLTFHTLKVAQQGRAKGDRHVCLCE